MANIRSAIKRAKQTEVRAQRNKAVKTRVKSVTRELLGQIQKGDPNAVEALKSAAAVIDRAAQRGVIHPRTAARKKSRLARRLNQMQAGT